jgi:Phosphotransferase enzyme family
MNPMACAGCTTPLPAAAEACPGCGAPVGRQLGTWVSPAAWVTAVEWVDGIRVVKMLKDLDDQANCARLRREAEALAGLSGRVPPGSVPEVLASGRGVIVTRFVAGISVQKVLNRRNVDRALPVLAAGRAVAAVHAVDLLGPGSRSEPGGLIPDLEAVEDLFPAWLLEAAVSAGDERAAHPVLVHGDCVPSNWLWDGERVCLLDFAQLRFGSPEFDPALAWARLRLLGGGFRNELGRRLSSIVLEPPWPATSVRWLANGLVIIAWYDRVRFAAARRGLRELREAALRVRVREVVQELAERRGG